MDIMVYKIGKSNGDQTQMCTNTDKEEKSTKLCSTIIFRLSLGDIHKE